MSAVALPVGFEPIQYDSGKVDTLLTVADTTITKGDALDFSSGYMQRATSSTTEVVYVALEDVTTAAGAHEEIECVRTRGVKFRNVCNSTVTQAKVGYKADLTDHDTANEAASTNDVFLITKVEDATNKIIQGEFVQQVD